MGLPQSTKTAPTENEDDAPSAKLRKMVLHPEILKPLGVLIIANAAISCQESTIARYAMETFDFSVGQVGMYYLVTSVPTTLASGWAGHLANRIGLRRTVGGGLLLQGLFTALGPKNNLVVNAISMVVLGLGMGFVDGGAPSLLGDTSDKYFQGSGKIYVLSNVGIQAGFVFGPIGGSALVEAYGFTICCIVTGLILVVYSPLVFTQPPDGNNEIKQPVLTA